MPDRRSIINYISSPFERGISCKASSKRCGAISSEMSPDFLTLPDLQVLSGPLCMACQTRSSDGATAVRSPPTCVSCPYGLWRPSAGGGDPCDTKMSEPQNGHPAITARCSDHKWTSHKKTRTAMDLDLDFGLGRKRSLTPATASH